MIPAKLLIVDDEKNAREGLQEILKQDGYDVKCAADGREALALFGEFGPDLVITDLKMPGMDGLDLLEQLKALNPDVPIIILTAYGTIKSAVRALREGADDYISKPVNVDELEIIIRKALDNARLRDEARILRERLREKYRFENIIGASPQMQEIFKTIEQVAPTNVTVLILGETGTGKELVAEAIHQRSQRSGGPFIKLNCTTLPETLLESELFGHEKGAFTGAHERRIGKFEIADKGTLFLDEIGELSNSTQVKLLRFLQEQKFERVGGNDVIEVDVRLIAATNRALEELIENGSFRRDLYYRLNVISIHLPPLRERSSDIPLLTHHFVLKYSDKNHKDVTRIAPEAMELLTSYSWPGNIRELENVLERAVVLCQGDMIEREHLPTIMGESAAAPEVVPLIPGATMREIERHAIERTLEYTGGNRTRAARVLGISVRKLQYKLKEYAQEKGQQ